MFLMKPGSQKDLPGYPSSSVFINSYLNPVNNILLICPGPGGYFWRLELKNTIVKNTQLGSTGKTAFFHYASSASSPKSTSQAKEGFPLGPLHQATQESSILINAFRRTCFLNCIIEHQRQLNSCTVRALVSTRFTLLQWGAGFGLLLFDTDCFHDGNLLVSDAC